MKTILVPTDFSKIARNAVDYAVEIAKLTKARLVLFNVYNLEIVPPGVPTILPINEMEKESANELSKIERSIHQKHGDSIKIECRNRKGLPVDEINYYTEEHPVDLIVMGMTGAGFLGEKLIGSITTSIIKKAKCPVLVIDKTVKFKKPEKITLACDYREVSNKNILEPLLELAKVFSAHIDVLHVVPEFETVPSVSKTLERIKFDHMLVSTDHSSHTTENADIIEGINDFAELNKSDMVVMIPRMHTGFEGFFFEPNTKRMAFHSRLPFLALHH